MASVWKPAKACHDFNNDFTLFYSNSSFINIDFIDFKTLNAQYLKTTCLIEFKLTGSIVWANSNQYTDFKAILNFYKNT